MPTEPRNSAKKKLRVKFEETSNDNFKRSEHTVQFTFDDTSREGKRQKKVVIMQTDEMSNQQSSYREISDAALAAKRMSKKAMMKNFKEMMAEPIVNIKQKKMSTPMSKSLDKPGVAKPKKKL